MIICRGDIRVGVPRDCWSPGFSLRPSKPFRHHNDSRVGLPRALLSLGKRSEVGGSI